MKTTVDADEADWNLMRFLPADLESVRIVLFDIYGTLLQSVPRADPNGEFSSWWTGHFSEPMPDYSLFNEKIRKHIGLCHARSKAAGVDFPEVQWPQIVQCALEEFGPQSCSIGSEINEVAASLAEVEQRHTLMPGAVELIRFFQSRELPIGIVSNAQSYTVLHLRQELKSAGISEWPFDEAWSFWSWKFGFSKPSPAVFQILSARAAARGWSRSQILFFGDRMDKDILPATAAGWRCVHIQE
jgi:putative hydrolase of the HAD superfamily